MTLKEFLLRHREPLPQWLADFKPGDAFDREAFFGSRVVYYPGSGDDAHPVRTFGAAHAAHCFVYADYLQPMEGLVKQLDDPERGFKGYRTLARLELSSEQVFPRRHPSADEDELRYMHRLHDRIHGVFPDPAVPHATDRQYHSRMRFGNSFVGFYAFLEVLQREDARSDAHGPARLAVLFLGTDAYPTYDALFCQADTPRAPFGFLLQDHGFGGNYDRFGNGGIMEHIAMASSTYPEWMLVADNTRVWNGYDRVAGVHGDQGGMHMHLRHLYRRTAAG